MKCLSFVGYMLCSALLVSLTVASMAKTINLSNKGIKIVVEDKLQGKY